MNEMPEAPHIELPEGWTFKPAERETFAEALDRKCNEMDAFNSRYRND